jgi:hypothetical protein
LAGVAVVGFLVLRIFVKKKSLQDSEIPPPIP